MEFTSTQLKQFEKYERVRRSGRYNMFMPQARQSTGMSTEDYLFIIENYSALKQTYDAVRKAKSKAKKSDIVTDHADPISHPIQGS